MVSLITTTTRMEKPAGGGAGCCGQVARWDGGQEKVGTWQPKRSLVALTPACPEDVYTSCLINLDPFRDSGTPSTIEELTCSMGPPHLAG